MKPLLSLFSSQSWHYRFGFNSEIDFCFWVLERDGLQVPPFDRHPDGDGSLRATGLDAMSWRPWLERAIAAYEERREFLKAVSRQQADIHPPRYTSSAAAWNGSPAVGHLLMTLDQEYEGISNQRASSKQSLVSIHAKCDAQLWKDLTPYRRTLPPVQIITVAYPGPVQAVIPPDTILLAVGNWEPTPSDLSSAILEGIGALANSAHY